MLGGYAVYAPMTIAELIEKQTKYEAELFNVDVRKDHRFLAEKIFQCAHLLKNRSIR